MNFTFNNSSIVSVNSGTIVLNVSGKTRTFVDAKLVSAIDGNIVLDLPEAVISCGTYLVIRIVTVERILIASHIGNGELWYHISQKEGKLEILDHWRYSKHSIRYATPEEIKDLDNQLAEENMRWNPDTMQIEKLRWKPGQGTAYFHIIIAGGIAQTDNDIWMDDATDKNNYEMGNCFKTKKEAEAKLEQIKELLKLTI